MKRIVATILITAAAVAPGAGASAASAYPLGAVYIRSGPGTQYPTVGLLQEGESANITAREGSWLKVSAAGSREGYMADWVTREVFDGAPSYVQVDADVLNLRSGPGLDQPVLRQLQQGERFQALEGLGGWLKLDAGALGSGWASREYLATVAGQGAPTPSPQPAPPAPQPAAGPAKVVMASRAGSLYLGPDSRVSKVTGVSAGEVLTYQDSAWGWLRAVNARGDRGWLDGAQALLWDRDVEFASQATYKLTDGDWRINHLRVREVVPDGSGLRLRTEPAGDAQVKRYLHPGDQMKLLYVGVGEFVQVMLSDGDVGWLARQFIKPVPGVPAEAASLTRSGSGILRLEVTGQTVMSRVDGDGRTLSLSLPINTRRRASLKVGAENIGEIAMGAGTLTVSFDRPFYHKVVEQTSGRTVVELRPLLDRAEQLTGADRRTYRFYTVGAITPAAAGDGASVSLSLPGAVAPAGVQLPAGVSLERTAAGVTARVSGGRSFAVKQGPGYVDLELYAPGLAGKRIVVDAGHGGVETGAVGPGGLREKESNLAIALKLQTALKSAGATVIMTRTADGRCTKPADSAGLTGGEQLRADLHCRAALANASGADAFVSVHGNDDPAGRERGTETYWTRENLNPGRSQELANLVQRELVGALGLRDRGAKDEMFLVTKYTGAPAVLAEVAFVGQLDEEALLRQDGFRQKAADALVRALQKFFQ